MDWNAWARLFFRTPERAGVTGIGCLLILVLGAATLPCGLAALYLAVEYGLLGKALSIMVAAMMPLLTLLIWGAVVLWALRTILGGPPVSGRR